MNFRLLLFKHPNSFDGGDLPADKQEILAPSAAVAVGLATGTIASAPRSALSHPDDRFVLVDDEGNLVRFWDSTNA